MDLLDRLRDLIVLAAVPGAGASGLLDASEDQLERMRKQAAEFGQDRLAKAAETISNGLIEMRGATSPRLLLELMCAQVLLPASAAPDRTASESDVGDLAARVDRLERQLAAAGSASRQDGARTLPRPSAPESSRPAPARTAPTGQRDAGRSAATPAPARQAAASARAPGGTATPETERAPAAGARPGGVPDADELRNRWSDVLDTVRDTSKVAWILLGKAGIDMVEGNVITMAFDSEGNAKGFAGSGSDGYLANVLERMFGTRPVIRAIVNPAAAGAAGSGGGRSTAGSPDSNPGASGRRASSPDPDPSSASPSGSGSTTARERGSSVTGSDTAASAHSGPDSRQGSRSGQGSPSGQGPRGGSGAGSQAGEDQAERGGAAGETAAGRPRGTKRGSRSVSTTAHQDQPSGSELADDPRPTDAAPGGRDDDLTGTDLIMRELGGRMIEGS